MKGLLLKCKYTLMQVLIIILFCLKSYPNFLKERCSVVFRNYIFRTFSILSEKCKLFDPNMLLEVIRIDLVHKAIEIVTRQKFDPYSWSHCCETLYSCPGNTPIRLLSTLYGTGLSYTHEAFGSLFNNCI